MLLDCSSPAPLPPSPLSRPFLLGTVASARPSSPRPCPGRLTQPPAPCRRVCSDASTALRLRRICSGLGRLCLARRRFGVFARAVFASPSLRGPAQSLVPRRRTDEPCLHGGGRWGGSERTHIPGRRGRSTPVSDSICLVMSCSGRRSGPYLDAF